MQNVKITRLNMKIMNKKNRKLLITYIFFVCQNRKYLKVKTNEIIEQFNRKAC